MSAKSKTTLNFSGGLYDGMELQWPPDAYHVPIDITFTVLREGPNNDPIKGHPTIHKYKYSFVYSAPTGPQADDGLPAHEIIDYALFGHTVEQGKSVAEMWDNANPSQPDRD